MEKTPWLDYEVQALLGIYAEDGIQQDFESTCKNHTSSRNQLYRKISSRLAQMGVRHSAQQCRDKINQLRQKYKVIKDHNQRTGADQKTSKWFPTLDRILGHKHSSNGDVRAKESTREETSSVEDFGQEIMSPQSTVLPKSESEEQRISQENSSQTMIDLKRESSEESDVTECVIPKLESSDASAASAPENSTPRVRYPCPTCGKTFDRPSKLERHKPIHAKKRKTLHQCQLCDKSFKELEKLIQHQKRHNRTNSHPCPDCGKVFDRRLKLERHLRTHLKKPKVPHQCPFCMKTFSKLHKLVRHERVHTGEKPFTCPVCGKRFADSSHCKTHEKTHESQPEKPHRCDECGMSFFKTSELRRHFRRHTGEKPFMCIECKKCFTRQSGLKRHMRSHTGERPHTCIVCKKGFTSRAQLNAHGLTHTGEKPYVCPVCGKGFSQLSNMKAHERSIHIKAEKYICSECSATFTRYKSIQLHQRVHTGEKPYLCITCGCRFSWSHCLNRHRRSLAHKQMCMEASKDGPSENSIC